MKKYCLAILIFISFSIFFNYSFAASQYDVLVNEIAWMGTANSANDEWIELFNNTSNSISLDGWSLKSGDEKIKIMLRGQIPANNYYLLERTDDSSVLGVAVDLIYRGALNNSGQELKLYDQAGNIIDYVNFISGWPYGNNTSKQTMERVNQKSWQTSRDAGGTPKSKNSSGVVRAAATKIPEKEVLLNSAESDNKVNVETASLINADALPESSAKEENIKSPWFLFLAVIAVIIVSAIIFIILKFRKV